MKLRQLAVPSHNNQCKDSVSSTASKLWQTAVWFRGHGGILSLQTLMILWLSKTAFTLHFDKKVWYYSSVSVTDKVWRSTLSAHDTPQDPCIDAFRMCHVTEEPKLQSIRSDLNGYFWKVDENHNRSVSSTTVVWCRVNLQRQPDLQSSLPTSTSPSCYSLSTNTTLKDWTYLLGNTHLLYDKYTS